MSNSYFQFKKFTIWQDKCAMKVSTDACLQGAWAPVAQHARSVLDIGTGTGLLSLMIAQRFEHTMIDAIEIDAAAARQALENASQSPFSNRINIIHGDIKSMAIAEKYDFIICNPPFFINSLKGPETARNNARHDVSLSQADLILLLKSHLATNGSACFLWPFTEHQHWAQLLAEAGMYLNELLLVKDNSAANVKRVISICSFEESSELIEHSLIIKEKNGCYTQHFISLLQPFYQKL